MILFIERPPWPVKGTVGTHAMKAQPQGWLDRPVKIIVPVGAGGSGDTLARVIAEHLSATFSQPWSARRGRRLRDLLGDHLEA